MIGTSSAAADHDDADALQALYRGSSASSSAADIERYAGAAASVPGSVLIGASSPGGDGGAESGGGADGGRFRWSVAQFTRSLASSPWT